MGSDPEKIGAGLLFCCNGDILLLRRSQDSGHPNTLGLPGGNRDEGEPLDDLIVTATREATEEMGTLPEFSLRGSLITKRGKRLQKHYSVFIVEISIDVKNTWRPILNKEHTMYIWIPLDEAARRYDLHPVVKLTIATEPNKSAVKEIVKKTRSQDSSTCTVQ